MTALLILGAGGHGRVVADAARLSERWTEIAFLDDRHPSITEIDGFPVLGTFAAAPSLLPRFAEAVVAVGDNRSRLRILGDLRTSGFRLPTVVHPSAAVSDAAELGPGTVVFARAAVNLGTRTGEGCIINTGATVDHDCLLGAGVHLSPGVHLGGAASIGEASWLGVGVNVKNGVTIGRDVMVGVGAAVLADLPDGVTAVGVPARVVETAPEAGADAADAAARGPDAAAAAAETSAATTAPPASPAPEAWPFYAPDEIDAARRVLASGKVNYWTGEEGRLFESEFAAYLGVPHAVALANGTLALEAALLATGIGPGDDVVVTPRTFVATAGVVVLRGGRPIFADVDRDSGDLTADTIEAALTPRTRAVIVVHLGGWPCDMDPIMELARTRGLAVIEDCAQSHGSRYRGRLTGSIGHIGAFSFCQDKIITTGGEGGMLVTFDEGVRRLVWSAKDHGKSWAAVYEGDDAAAAADLSDAASPADPSPSFRWLHESFGSNWRMTEIQAAIGRIQLQKLDAWVEQRRLNAGLLADGLADLAALRIPLPPAHIQPSYYRFYAYVRPEALREGWTRDHILAGFAARGIPALSGSCSEIYLEKAFAAADLQPPDRLPVARELGETSIAFPVHPTLKPATLERWAETARDVLTKATR